MKPTFTCIAILLAAVFLGSGCATTTPSGGHPSADATSNPGGGQEKATPPAQGIYTPPVAAPQQ